MVTKDPTKGTKYSDSFGTSVGVTSVPINEASKVFIALLEKELGSGKWDDASIRKVADQVWDRAGTYVSQHNDEAQARIAREESRTRLEALPEADRIIKSRLPDLPIERLSVEERRDLAGHVVADESDGVVRVGKFNTWTDPRTLGPLKTARMIAEERSAEKEG